MAHYFRYPSFGMDNFKSQLGTLYLIMPYTNKLMKEVKKLLLYLEEISNEINILKKDLQELSVSL
ncbi:hypothetical protein [Clostridium sp. CTA-19]